MSSVDYFSMHVESLSNHELVIYYHYCYEGLLPNNKLKLQEELSDRKIQKKHYDGFLKRRIDHKRPNSKNCVRCGSWKYRNELEYYYQPGRYSTVTLELDNKICAICGYNPLKDMPKNFFKRILKYIERQRKMRVIKVEKWYD